MSQLKPRQLDIMQSLAKMLGEKGPVKITTSLLAAECEITEAAIYRHFPSKKKIYSGLVDFCEQNIFDLINSINSAKGDELEKVKKICKKFNPVILDKTSKSVVIQVTALRAEIDKLALDLKSLGLISTSRTGAVAMTKAVSYTHLTLPTKA